jgi:hypothetical protein
MDDFKEFMAETWLAWLLLLATLAPCAIHMVRAAKVNAHCLRQGWTSGTVTWNLDGYCVARTDQTDVVVPWQEAGRR